MEIWLSAWLWRRGVLRLQRIVQLRLRGDLDVAGATAALHDVLARHDALRARFSPTGDRLMIALACPDGKCR